MIESARDRASLARREAFAALGPPRETAARSQSLSFPLQMAPAALIAALRARTNTVSCRLLNNDREGKIVTDAVKAALASVPA